MVSSAYDIKGIEEGICRIKGVLAAEVIVTSTKREIEKIHVLAQPERNPKQIVRDIETLIRLQHQIDIDYRRISLVQFDHQLALEFLKPRPKLLSAVVSYSGSHATVQVTLSDTKGLQVSAESSNMTESARDVALLGAGATLAALQKFHSSLEEVKLVDLIQIELAGEPVVAVALVVSAEQGHENLIGASILNHEPAFCGGRAVLDAVNRRFFKS
ncbi:MAG: hypothetical protein HY326_04055 [Chloroflexi bacterium]|nr:hypothetical protein [Chloroflexota bacterium]